MKTIIVEDEKHARDNLESLLKSIEPDIEIQAKLDTVKNVVKWLSENQTDLIFLDIHLADDISFKIFEHVEVKTPIIFTTAYDQYALRAFKVNSVDYLLKPIDKNELQKSIEKFKDNQLLKSGYNIKELVEELKNPPKEYQKRFIVNRGDKIMSVVADQIAYFEGEDRYVSLIKKDGSKYIIDYKLSDLENILDPSEFFRLNRSFITHFGSIDKIISVSKSRFKVELKPTHKREIIVSSANSRDFKNWLNK